METHPTFGVNNHQRVPKLNPRCLGLSAVGGVGGGKTEMITEKHMKTIWANMSSRAVMTKKST